MRDERTKVIINEIHYWKQNRLLPATYCDFLLALYTQGDGQEEKRGSRLRWSSLLFYSFLAVTLILLPLSFLVIYFTQMGIIMQTGLLSSFVITAWIHSGWLKYRKSIWFPLPLIVGLLIFFVLSITAVGYYFPGSSSLAWTAAFHCFLWVAIGHRLSVKTLTISGLAGFLLLAVLVNL
ncbi:hypothetical protein QRD89_11880 [Halobacillus sp. ACCC02827]|uniref:hypothetical protein n=1 Tax=Halobacillus sp. ACCC02827 TaxID=3052090 RepID=UPI00256FBAAB|nr:hypothetical protein [Halobacillus sp. ACCC02827]WJE14418.1 hypothetical protein QRD89_11880 [Halobacillus sp. ACCC02827]